MNTAMIWGADGGIGKALVARLVENNWTVVAVTRHPEKVEGLTEHVITADVSSPYEVNLAVTAAAQFVDEINLMIYAAGDITSGKVADLLPETWNRIINANLTGAFLVTHHTLPLLSADAHLVFLGAISERLQLPGLSAYAAAKTGLEAFVNALIKEERKRRVTIIRPGAVDTPLWQKVPMKLPSSALSAGAVAEQIVDAYRQGHKGRLDIVG